VNLENMVVFMTNPLFSEGTSDSQRDLLERSFRTEAYHHSGCKLPLP
jgi:hypothetical protein